MSTDATPGAPPEVAAPVAPPEVAAPVAPPAPAVPEEGTDDATAKRGRKKQNKVPYREKDTPKLLEWPKDYDPQKHTPFSPEDFEAEDIYWDKRAEYYAGKVTECKKNAELFRKFGSSEKRKAAEKAVKLSEKLMQLRAELEADGMTLEDMGVDLSALLG